MPHDYERDGAAIYRQSFATIRAEADLRRLGEPEQTVAVRMIHAAGEVDLTRDIAFSPGAVAAGMAALRAGAPILTDVQMVASGVTRRRTAQVYAELARLVADGAVRPVISATYPLDRAAEASAAVAGGHSLGKVVVTV